MDSVLKIQAAATKASTPMTANTVAIERCSTCSARATEIAPPAMNRAESTLTAATTRARWSGLAQACTAAKDGTMKRPPAAVRISMSMARCHAIGCWKKGATVTPTPSEVAPCSVQAMSSETIAMITAAIGAGKVRMRPFSSQAASAEPNAMPMANTAE